MEDTMRASDQIKATRSYVVKEDPRLGLVIQPSHWVAGYSEGHKETQLEAVDFAIEVAEQKMTEAQARVVELNDMRVTLLAGEPTA